MGVRFADRMGNVQKSFIREILKVTVDPNVISFAGGLPNPASFPVQEIQEAADKVLMESGAEALQYSTTEGYLPLRQYISDRYLKTKGLEINPDEILITNGSQQGLDLIGKVMLNRGDDVLIERPGYLGAIQAFSIFEPVFRSVRLLEDGADVQELKEILEKNRPKLFYTVPNFQNPSGITYSAQTRKDVAGLLENSDTLLVEDDPYGELRFMGEDKPPIKTYLLEDSVLLGSFSKIMSPGMRLGWICARPDIMEKLVIAKQASDLHSNYFSQRIAYQYFSSNDVDAHIQKIRRLYKAQRDCMVSMIEEYFPKDVAYTTPEGGMFLWATLPKGLSSLDLLEIAARNNVVFVPGDPFYANEKNTGTLRLNYTNSEEPAIKEGIKRLAGAIRQLMK